MAVCFFRVLGMRLISRGLLVDKNQPITDIFVQLTNFMYDKYVNKRRTFMEDKSYETLLS